MTEVIENLTKMDAIQAIVEMLPQIELPVKHTFCPGIYVRSTTFPKGVIAVGAIHITEHPFFVTRGTLYVWDEFSGWKFFCAGNSGVTFPGTRRLGYAPIDAEFSSVHATDLCDPEEIAKRVTEFHDFDRAQALEMFSKKKLK